MSFKIFLYDANSKISVYELRRAAFSSKQALKVEIRTNKIAKFSRHEGSFIYAFYAQVKLGYGKDSDVSVFKTSMFAHLHKDTEPS